MNFAEHLKYIESNHQDLWATCYPRIYENTHSYGSPKIPAVVHALKLIQIKNNFSISPRPAKIVYAAASIASKFDFPTYFVAKDFFIAVSHTQPPEGLRWVDLNLPHEAGALCLPVGMLNHPTEGACNTLCWVRVRDGERLQFADGWPTFRIEGDMFFLYAILHERDNIPILTEGLSASEEPFISDFVINHSPDESLDTPYDLETTLDDKGFLRQCTSIVFGILTAMVSRPSLLIEGKRTGSAKKKTGTAQKQFWSPNVIGRDYQIVRESGAGEASNKKQGFHWRKGFYTHQVKGDYRNNPEFVPVAMLPRDNLGQINWKNTPDEIITRFWKHHRYDWHPPKYIFY